MRSRGQRRRGLFVAATAVAALSLTVACTTGNGQTAAVGPSSTGPVNAATTGTSAPGGSSGTTTTIDAPLPHGPFDVKSFQITFTDLTRVTEAGNQTPEKPGRVLETWVFRPDAPGPFPLIVFSHGLGGHPTKFNQLLTAWAKAGFVIAAPAFPLTNNTTPGFSQNWTGLAKQPGDVSFVIDQMLARNADVNDELHDLLLPDRIGVGGLSLGGATTYGVAFNDCCRDDRVKAVEVLSGAQLPVGGENHLDGHVPLLIMHGDKDPALPYQMEVDGYAKAKGPVWFVTLIGGGHAEPFEDFPSAYDALDEKLTTDFWMGTLGHDPEALARVDADGTVPGLASIESK
jgi:dienelactone hydrolase